MNLQVFFAEYKLCFLIREYAGGYPQWRLLMIAAIPVGTSGIENQDWMRSNLRHWHSKFDLTKRSVRLNGGECHKRSGNATLLLPNQLFLLIFVYLSSVNHKLLFAFASDRRSTSAPFDLFQWLRLQSDATDTNAAECNGIGIHSDAIVQISCQNERTRITHR